MIEAKTIVITSVTRGLGRAMAEKFAVLGHRVIGCGRSVAGIETMAEALGRRHRFDVVDVARDAAVSAWAKAAIAQYYVELSFELVETFQRIGYAIPVPPWQ